MTITSDPLAQPRIGSLFSGYGGLELGIMAALGGRVVWHCEFDNGPSKILAHHHPTVPNYGDVTAVDWTAVEPVEILCGGFPCQDVSQAGKRAGMKPGTRSGLWAHMRYAIAQLRPQLVVAENVRGLLSAHGEHSDELDAALATVTAADHLAAWLTDRQTAATTKGNIDHARTLAARRVRVMGLHRRAVARARRIERRLIRAVARVLGDLADLGYDARYVGLPAAGVGAPHNRFRVFILAVRRDAADPGSVGLRQPAVTNSGERAGSGEQSRGETVGGSDPYDVAADAAGEPRGERGAAGPGEAEGGGPFGEPRGRGDDVVADADGERLQGLDGGAAAGGDGPGAVGCGDRGPRDTDAPDASLITGSIDHRNDVRARRGTDGREQAAGRGAAAGSADASSDGRAEGCHVADGDDGPTGGRGAREPLGVRGVAAVDWGVYGPAIARWEAVLGRPAPTPHEAGSKGQPRLSPVFVEWMMGLPEGHVTQVPGVTRNEQLKALGNGVVPQQAAEAIRWLLSVGG